MIRLAIIRRSFSKATVLYSETDDIYFNLATEEYLFNQKLTNPTLFLWRNNKTIVIGRHQNPWKECHLQAMEKDGVTLSRRITGGGAVYHDLGNTCFSFLTPYKPNENLQYKSVNNAILLNSLKMLGVSAEVSGRNDITHHTKKISGSAYKLNLGNLKTGEGKKSLHHGTVLFNVETQALKKYLNPNKAKLESKGVTSVISRVMNLNEEFPLLNHAKFCEAAEKCFLQYYQATEVQSRVLDYQEFEHNPYVEKRFKELKSWEWLYGATPDFKNNIETRFNWGIVDIYFDVEQGVIRKAKVYSDSIWIDYITSLNEILNIGNISYDFEGVKQIEEQLVKRHPQTEFVEYTAELTKWLHATI